MSLGGQRYRPGGQGRFGERLLSITACHPDFNLEQMCLYISGRLGYGNTDDIGNSLPLNMGNNLSTVDLGSDFNASKVICGKQHTCALSNQYEVRCWGQNNVGQLV